MNLYIFTFLNAHLFPKFEDADTDVMLYVGVITIFHKVSVKGRFLYTNGL